MFESPHSLKDLCIDFISDNIAEICNESEGADVGPLSNVLKNSEVYLPRNVSEQLLESLGNKFVLTDELLLLFDHRTTRLQQVHISDASKITIKGLSVLKNHKILQLEVCKLIEVTVSGLIACLGEWTLRNLKSLNISHCTFIGDKICVTVALTKLKNLHALNVSFTEFNLRGLDIIAEDLPLLENLDISETMIRDITPLRKCKENLKVLKMYNLRIVNSNDFMSVLEELTNIRFLDISDDRDDPFSLVSRNPLKVTVFLRNITCLPHLMSLDISGKDGIFSDDLETFLKAHPSLKFLGLMLTDACFFDMFTKETDDSYNPELVISGCANGKQLFEALKRYLPRKSYIQKTLFHLYSHIHYFKEPYIDLIELVLDAMKRYSQALAIQMATTACLYNLSRGAKGGSIHPHLLKRIVNLTLKAMENFPKHQQLQKNALLTLCSDRILQDVTFDQYHCAELVMESLIAFEDATMNRMSVAICSILAAKISTSQTSTLGTKSTYMERLLSIVRAKTASEELDIMMKFTLSALWNLTDESPATCTVFLNMGGMELFLRVLRSFEGESAVETKVLGLVNNIAEVSYLRPYLMKDEFMTTLRALLHSSHVDVSYFAAGIVAHLGSDVPESWICETISRDEILAELEDVVLKWSVPETEMVAYRSFAPFFPLLHCYNTFEVQLWAVWAIHHVCSKNPKRYCPMLVEEGGASLMDSLVQNPTTNVTVADICRKIQYIIKQPLSSDL